MGKINLTPLRVRKRALANLQTKRTRNLPVWLDVVSEIPPAQILTRNQPIPQPLTQVRTHALPDGRTRQQASIASSKSKSAKASRPFSPAHIRYEEDSLRKQFFSDHPWELARPRVVLETTGNQHKHVDWSTGLLQPGLPLSGESVVQRQLWLLENVPDMTIDSSYDIARREFYAHRRQEETRRRVTREEALHLGAQPEKSILQWSMEVENKAYEDWESWARSQVVEQVQRNAAFSGGVAPAEEDVLRDNEDGNGQAVAQNNSSRVGQSIGAPGETVFARERQRQASRIGARI